MRRSNFRKIYAVGNPKIDQFIQKFMDLCAWGNFRENFPEVFASAPVFKVVILDHIIS